MSSTLLDITEAIRGALASLTYGSTGTQPNVVRQNWMSYTVEELQTPLIAVAPGSLTITRISRTVHQYDCDVQVFVGRYVQTDSEADEAYELAEEVIDELRAHTWDEELEFPTGTTSPTSIEVELNPDDALNERNVWRCVITARYTIFRDAS